MARPRRINPIARPEQDLQRAVADLLRLYERMGRLIWFAVPNGGARSRTEAAIMKGLGVRAGVADICILFAGGPTVWIELKSRTGRLTPAQRGFLAWCAGHGHQAVVARDVANVDRIVRANLGVPGQRHGFPHNASGRQRSAADIVPTARLATVRR